MNSTVVAALAGEADDDGGETVAADVNQHAATARAKPRAAAEFGMRTQMPGKKGRGKGRGWSWSSWSWSEAASAGS